MATQLSRLPLEWIALGLVAWLPVETWVLKFVPYGSYMLVLPDVLSLVCLLVVLLYFAAIGVSEVRRRSRSSAYIAVGWFVGAALLSALFHVLDNPPIGVLYWFRIFCRFMPLTLIVGTEPWRTRTIGQLHKVLAPTVAFQVLVGVLEYVFRDSVARFFWPGQFAIGSIRTAVDTLPSVGDYLVAGTMGHYNTYGWFLVLAGTALYWRVASLRSTLGVRPRAWLIGLVAACVPLVLLSQSRQVALALIALAVLVGIGSLGPSGPLSGLRERAKRLVTSWGTGARWTGTLAACLLGVLLIYGAFTLVRPVAVRYKAILDPHYWEVASLNRGYAVIKIAPSVLQRSPILGMGPGSFQSEKIDEPQVSFGVRALGLDSRWARFLADVGWVNVFAQIGLLGTGALIFMVVVLWKLAKTRVSPPSLRLAAIALLLFLLIGMFGTTAIIYKPTSILFWSLYGLVASAPPSGAQTESTLESKGSAGLAS